MTPEETNAFLAVIVAALTQLGIPAVFVGAWWWERREHARTLDRYTRDLRAICKTRLTPPSDPDPAQPQ